MKKTPKTINPAANVNALANYYTANRPAHITDNTGKKYQLYDLFDPARPRISYGNEKTGGIPSINTLAGDKTIEYSGSLPAVLAALFGGCGGTCSGTCPGCYAEKITRNIAPAIKYCLNTLEAKIDPVRFITLCEKELYGNPVIEYKIVRIHDSGDFFTRDYLNAVMDLIRRHPGTRYGAYTKERNLILEYGLDNIPGNMSLSCSPWKGYCDPIGNLPQFIYDNGTDPEISALPHCPAVDKNGKRTGVKCIQCLHCYTANRGVRWSVYAH